MSLFKYSLWGKSLKNINILCWVEAQYHCLLYMHLSAVGKEWWSSSNCVGKEASDWFLYFFFFPFGSVNVTTWDIIFQWFSHFMNFDLLGMSFNIQQWWPVPTWRRVCLQVVWEWALTSSILCTSYVILIDI